MAMLNLARPGLPSAPIEVVRKLFPTDFLIHVGAGRGMGPLAQWRQWELTRALVVDADPQTVAWVALAADGRDWKTSNAIVAAVSGPVAWHEAADSDESGLLSPANLAEPWEGVGASEECQRQARTLDGLLLSEPPFHDAWLLIDCLLSLAILQGASGALANARVVWLRAVADDLGLQDAGISVVESFLADVGFSLVDWSSSAHSTQGYALFAKKDGAELLGKIEQLQQQLLAEQTRHSGLQNELASLRRDKTRVHQLELQLKQKEARQRALESVSAAFTIRSSRQWSRRSHPTIGSGWKSMATSMSDRLARLRNRHAGERVVLVANGPSLNRMDLSFLRSHTVIGMNKIFLGLRKFAFYPRYYVAVNDRVIQQSAAQIRGLSCIKFISARNAQWLPEDALTHHVEIRDLPARFCHDIAAGVHEGWTVTFVALQMTHRSVSRLAELRRDMSKEPRI